MYTLPHLQGSDHDHLTTALIFLTLESSTKYVTPHLSMQRSPLRFKMRALGSSPFARRYLGNVSHRKLTQNAQKNFCVFCVQNSVIHYFLFLWLLRCFTSPGLLRAHCCAKSCNLNAAWGCPIRTSPDQSLLASSPTLIAGCYVLHRLSLPRHPPYALRH